MMKHRNEYAKELRSSGKYRMRVVRSRKAYDRKKLKKIDSGD